MSRQFIEDTFNDVTKSVQRLRNPHADIMLSEESNRAQETQLFNFECRYYSDYGFLIECAKIKAFSALCKIVKQCLDEQGIVSKIISDNKKEFKEFIVAINEKNCWNFYMFCDYGIPNNQLRRYFSSVLSQAATQHIEIKDYKYVALVDEYAYSAVLDHNNDKSDPSRGTDLISLKDFFIKYLDKDDYGIIRNASQKSTEEIKSYFGMKLVKTLTPNAMSGFKKTMEYIIRSFAEDNDCLDTLSANQLKVIKEQFIDSYYFEAMLGKTDFAESMMTAEWLYDSLKSSGKLDLSAIVMGYFKAIEQLLFRFISYCTDEKDHQGRKIYCNGKLLLLTGNLLESEREHLNLGSLTAFFGHIDPKTGVLYRRNTDLLNSNIEHDTYTYIIEKLQEITTQRNGFLHKDNLDSWAIVENVRKTAYNICYLILGSYQFDEKMKANFQISNSARTRDFYNLCTYVNYHANQPFYIEDGEGKMLAYFSGVDDTIQFDDYGNANYSGACFRRVQWLTNEKQLLSIEDIRKGVNKMYDETKFEIDDLQDKKIFVGTMRPVEEGMEFSGPQVLIFNNGKFCNQGSSVKPEY